MIEPDLRLTFPSMTVFAPVPELGPRHVAALQHDVAVLGAPGALAEDEIVAVLVLDDLGLASRPSTFLNAAWVMPPISTLKLN
jgi:hypothetical protein